MKIVQLVFDFILSIVSHFFPRKEKGRQCTECGALVGSDCGCSHCKQPDGSSPGCSGSDTGVGKTSQQSGNPDNTKAFQGGDGSSQQEIDIDSLMGRAMIVVATGGYLFG